MEDHNLDKAHWMSFCVTTHYIDWQSELVGRYKNYIIQEAERTNKFPKKLAKEFLAVCVEHGWKGHAQDTAMMIAQYG